MATHSRPVATYLRAARAHQGHPGVVRRGYISRLSLAAYSPGEQMVDSHAAAPNGVGEDRSHHNDENRPEFEALVIDSIS